MSEASSDTLNTPKCWSHDHQKKRDTSKQMQEKHLTDDCTDVWYNIVQKSHGRLYRCVVLHRTKISRTIVQMCGITSYKNLTDDCTDVWYNIV
jgi:hypothetical protein